MNNTNAIVNAVTMRSSTAREVPSSTGCDTNVLTDLTRQRRLLPNHSSERTAISKRIRNEIRRLKALERHRRIDKIPDDYKCLSHISQFKSRRGKAMITQMTSLIGEKVTDRQGIAHVFAEFYERLYTQRKPAKTTHCTSQHDHHTDEHTPSFTQGELATALQQLCNGRSCDYSGIKAEMLKEGSDALHQHPLQLYNDIIRRDATPPQQWKHTIITIIHKSGDPTLPSNYRPIAIIPLMYKLFARLLYNRLAPLFDKHQTPVQAGLRHDYSTDDHLYTLTIFHEQSVEWQLNLWVAAIDFKKAFDSIDHDKPWDALSEQKIPTPYIRLIRDLYTRDLYTRQYC